MNNLSSNGWTAFFEQQKVELFDYLTRMTGQMSRSMETLGEIQSVMASSSLQSESALREAIYTTARNFNADIWNAPTPMLSNSVNRLGPETDPVKDVESALQGLSGPERETLLLLGRGRFGDIEASRIMGISQARFSEILNAALQHMQAALAGKPLGLAFTTAGQSPEWQPLVASIKGFTPLELSRHRTADLSEIMQELRESRLGWVSKRPVLIGMLFALLILAGLFLLR